MTSYDIHIELRMRMRGIMRGILRIQLHPLSSVRSIYHAFAKESTEVH